jgi:TetR/AcrR family transcriptional regulator, regulator of cefoperazone and chloramphenicol sensitivity
MEPVDSLPPDDTRDRLIEAAEIVFAEKGYDAATTREICLRAGVRNMGAVNYHFGSKERLYADAVSFAMQTCTKGVPFPHWPPGTSPIVRLTDFIRVLMVRLLEVPRQSAMTLMTREMTRTQPSAVTTEAVELNIRPIANTLSAILEDLIPAVPFAKRVLVAFSIVGQCLYYRQNRAVGEVLFGRDIAGSFNADILSQHISQFTLAALGLTTPISQSSTQGDAP